MARGPFSMTGLDRPPEPIPAGKRTVRANRWGNVNAYVAGRFWKTLGREYAVGTDEAVEAFLSGEDK